MTEIGMFEIKRYYHTRIHTTHYRQSGGVNRPGGKPGVETQTLYREAYHFGSGWRVVAGLLLLGYVGANAYDAWQSVGDMSVSEVISSALNGEHVDRILYGAVLAALGLPIVRHGCIPLGFWRSQSLGNINSLPEIQTRTERGVD